MRAFFSMVLSFSLGVCLWGGPANSGYISLEEYSVPADIVEELRQRSKRAAVPNEPHKIDAVVAITFTGGTVGANMARVLNVLTRPLAPKLFYEELPPNSISQLKLGECKAFSISPKLWPTPDTCTLGLGMDVRSISLRVGAGLRGKTTRAGAYYIPIVGYREQSVPYAWDATQAGSQDYVDRLDSNWSDYITSKTSLEIASKKTSDTTREILLRDITSVKWHVPIYVEDANQDYRILEFELNDIPNVTASVVLAAQIPKSLNLNTTTSPTETYDHCVMEHVYGQEGSYASLLPSLYATSDSIECQNDDLHNYPINVSIIDTRVAAHPELSQALLGTPGAYPADNSCVIDAYKEKENHGTFLAGIVASSENDKIFSGIASRTQLNSIEYVKNGEAVIDAEARLANYIKSRTPQELSGTVFLFASEFSKFPTDGPKSTLMNIWSYKNGKPSTQLREKNVRFTKEITEAIRAKRPLFIVAAGQVDYGEGEEIHGRVDVSPQNLGDQNNVIVVGACENCDGPATLWSKSNRSPDGKFVHLLAPGAMAIAGLINDRNIGQVVGGTSSAAAFTAGVAANMLKCYPNTYRFNFSGLKEWMILTSDPSMNDDVAGGKIDPNVAMLDPNANWLKQPNKPVTKIKELEWCGRSLEIKDGSDQDLLDVRRLTKIPDTETYVITTSRSSYSLNGTEFEVTRRGPHEVSNPFALLKVKVGDEDWCSLKKADIDDLIVQREKLYADCAATPRCDD
jgi:subtilisin family serine protease